MDQQAPEICELIENTATELQSKPHAFWSCLYYSLAPRIDYWLRHMPPRQTIGAAARVDRALLTAAYSLGYDSIFEDQLTLRRLRLPARMRGCGIRSRVWLAPIAYAASFIEAADASERLGPLRTAPVREPATPPSRHRRLRPSAHRPTVLHL